MLSEYSRDSMEANEMKDGDADDFLDFCKNRKKSHSSISANFHTVFFYHYYQLHRVPNDHMTFNANICKRKITEMLMLFSI